jgi:hypothetical protein
MTIRWNDDFPPASVRDDGGTTATGAADPSPGGRPGRALLEAVVIGFVAVACLVVPIAAYIHR